MESAQVTAWRESLGWLQTALASVINRDRGGEDWGVVLEFEIPRRGYRIDALLLASGSVRTQSSELISVLDTTRNVDRLNPKADFCGDI